MNISNTFRSSEIRTIAEIPLLMLGKKNGNEYFRIDLRLHYRQSVPAENSLQILQHKKN